MHSQHELLWGRHLLAVLGEDVAVLAGGGARGDEAHPPPVHALLQLPLDDLRTQAAVLLPTLPVKCFSLAQLVDNP
jgi:hypothetical protein